MANLMRIAVKNLFRYKRRTVLTAILIVFGVVLAIVTAGVVAGFKYSATGILTDTMLSHLQVHKRGYLEIINSSPLNFYLNDREMKSLADRLDKNPEVAAYSPRINFMVMASIGKDTTTMKITAVEPEREAATCPALAGRLSGVGDKRRFLASGRIIVPDSVARAFNLKIGSSVVLVCTNREGAVNAMIFSVAGTLESFGNTEFLRSGYIHLSDAENLLEMETPEISEVAVRLRDVSRLKSVTAALTSGAAGRPPLDGAVYAVNSWESLSPFTSILMLVDILTNITKIVLIAIVLISILNIMMMAVFERTREIGTISAMGTKAGRIRSLFVLEGLILGIITVIAGGVLGALVLVALNASGIVYTAGPFTLTLRVFISPLDFASVALTVVIVSVLASLQPAFKASRLDPVDALGHV